MPRLRIIAAGVCVMLAAAGTIPLLFKADRFLTLSRGDRGRFSGPNLSDGGCPLLHASRPFEGGVAESWIPSCVSAPFPMKLVAIGDSHAQTYRRLLGRYAFEARVPVYIYYKFACGFPQVTAPNSVQGYPCAGFVRAAMRELKRDLSPNDVLFMPALRVTRLEARSGMMKAPTPRQAAEGYVEALALLNELSSTKATLMFEAPKPVFPHAVYRCLDWFNRRNPECIGGFDIARADMEKLRAPALAAMERLQREVPGVVIWDPLPVLCPGDPCSAWKGRIPLYFDGDHISGNANDLLFGSFKNFVSASRH